EGMANASVHDVKGARFEFFIYAPDIFADDAEEKKKHARKESHHHDQRGKALHGLVQKHFRIDCNYGVKSGHQDGDCAQYGGGPDRDGGEREYPVQGELETPERAVFALPRMAYGALYGHARLPKPDPTSHSPQI